MVLRSVGRLADAVEAGNRNVREPQVNRCGQNVRETQQRVVVGLVGLGEDSMFAVEARAKFVQRAGIEYPVPADTAVLTVSDHGGAVAGQLGVGRQGIEGIDAAAERQRVMAGEVIERAQHVIDLADNERLFLLDCGRGHKGIGGAQVAHVGCRIEIEHVETCGIALF